MGVLPKVLIGCASLLVLLGLIASLAIWWGARKLRGMAAGAERNPAAFAARLMTAGNPELEVVSQDNDRKTVTIRNRNTGESLTVNAAELEKGNLAFRNEKGEQVAIEGNSADGKRGLKVTSRVGTMTIGDGAGALPTSDWVPSYPGAKPVGTVAKKGADGESGMYRPSSRGPGFKVERAGAEGQEGAAGSLNAQHVAEARSVSISAVGADGGTQVTVVYDSKKR